MPTREVLRDAVALSRAAYPEWRCRRLLHGCPQPLGGLHPATCWSRCGGRFAGGVVRPDEMIDGLHDITGGTLGRRRRGRRRRRRALPVALRRRLYRLSPDGSPAAGAVLAMVSSGVGSAGVRAGTVRPVGIQHDAAGSNPPTAARMSRRSPDRCGRLRGRPGTAACGSLRGTRPAPRSIVDVSASGLAFDGGHVG